MFKGMILTTARTVSGQSTWNLDKSQMNTCLEEV